MVRYVWQIPIFFGIATSYNSNLPDICCIFIPYCQRGSLEKSRYFSQLHLDLFITVFFMQNRTLKGIQEIELLFKLASKYDLDSQTRQAKLQHIQEKLSELKKIKDEESVKQKKELKMKNKQIQKLRERQRNLLERLGQPESGSPLFYEKAGNRIGKNSATVKLNSTIPNQKQMIEKQIQKKIKAQEKLRELKYKLEKLQVELLRFQKENQALRSQNQRLNEQNYSQKLMIQAFLKQEEYESSQDQSQGQGQMCEGTNKGQVDEQIETPSERKVFKMMDLEGERIHQIKKPDSQVFEQDEFLKYIDQVQTDDQEEKNQEEESIHHESSDSDNHEVEITNYDEYKQEKITRLKLLKQKESEQKDKVQDKIEKNEENKIDHEQQQKLFRMKKERWFTWWIKWW